MRFSYRKQCTALPPGWFRSVIATVPSIELLLIRWSRPFIELITSCKNDKTYLTAEKRQKNERTSKGFSFRAQLNHSAQSYGVFQPGVLFVVWFRELTHLWCENRQQLCVKSRNPHIKYSHQSLPNMNFWPLLPVLLRALAPATMFVTLYRFDS